MRSEMKLCEKKSHVTEIEEGCEEGLGLIFVKDSVVIPKAILQLCVCVCVCVCPWYTVIVVIVCVWCVCVAVFSLSLSLSSVSFVVIFIKMQLI